jgi:hypothetical protein
MGDLRGPNSSNFITTPAGRIVNFIPSIAVAVVISDSTVLQPGLLFVGTGGDVYAKPASGASIVCFKNVPSGTFLPIYITQVGASTTATDMLMCY